MTPSARLSSVIELLDIITSSTVPAEHSIRTYFRTRRYAGSKDRRWITEFLYALFRRLGEADWMLAETGLPVSSRGRALAGLSRFENVPLEDIQSTYVSGTYAGDALSDDETAALEKLETLDLSSMPADALGNFPAWLASEIHTQYGDQAPAILASFQDRAPLTLRVNRLRGDREEVLRLLAEEGINAHPTKLSPLGIILEGRVNIAGNPVMERGLVEIQDEAAQLSSTLAEAKPGMQVIDFCAGAGGKSLAMAADMDNSGQIHAFDVNSRRMKDIAIRCRRSGVHIIQSVHLKEGSENKDILSPVAETAERVFVDAPCSGSGTWRRQPDQKWFFDAEKLAELIALQQQILGQAAQLVAPGGRLIYATCSILAQENQEQIDWFLDHHTDFSITPVSEILPAVGLSKDIGDQFLQLTPDVAGTDGFFTAILTRRR